MTGTSDKNVVKLIIFIQKQMIKGSPYGILDYDTPQLGKRQDEALLEQTR